MKPLSDRLQWMFDNNYMDWDIVSDAIQLAKSVESAPVVTTEQVGPTMAYVYFEDPPGPLKRECALVPLPQQSET